MDNNELLKQWRESFGNEEKLQKKYGAFTDTVLQYARDMADMPFEVNPQVFENLRKVKIAYKQGKRGFGGFYEDFQTDLDGETPSSNGVESTISVKVYVGKELEEKLANKFEIGEFDNAKLTLLHELNHAVCHKEYYLSDQYGDDTQIKVLNLHAMGEGNEGLTPKQLRDANLLENGYLVERINDMPLQVKNFDRYGNLFAGSLKTNYDALDLHEGITELIAIKMFLKNNSKFAKDANGFVERNAQYLPFVRIAQVYNLLYDDVLSKTYFNKADEKQKQMLAKIRGDFTQVHRNYGKFLDAIDEINEREMDYNQFLESVQPFKEFMSSWQKDILKLAKSQEGTNALGSDKIEELIRLTNSLNKMETYRNTFEEQGMEIYDKENFKLLLAKCDKDDANLKEVNSLE